MGLSKTNRKEYERIHHWLRYNYSKVGVCEHCKRTINTQWSNRTGLYLKDRSDYQELCIPWHHFYDTFILHSHAMYVIRPKKYQAPLPAFFNTARKQKAIHRSTLDIPLSIYSYSKL